LVDFWSLSDIKASSPISLGGLAWITNTLAQQGKKLEAGMIVITGSVIATEYHLW
jgi:2-keto-4-pentenoate hydratase